MRTAVIICGFWAILGACQGTTPLAEPAADTTALDAAADAVDGDVALEDLVQLEVVAQLDLTGDDAEADTAAEGADSDVTTQPPLDEGPLVDTPPPVETGLAATISRVALSASAPKERNLYLRITTQPTTGPDFAGLTWHVGAEAALYRIPAPGDEAGSAATPTNAIGWALRPGTAVFPGHLVAWRPGPSQIDVTIDVFDERESAALGSFTLALTGESAARQRHWVGDVLIDIDLATDVTPLASHAHAGISLDGSSSAAMEPYRETLRALFEVQSFELKIYQGTRPLLVKAGCDSAEACAAGGPNYPCVSTCACACDATACDCDFSALETQMEQRVGDTIRRLFPGTGPEAWPAGLKIHYVFKRSLGGTTSCVANGEIDVTPETYARLIAEAVAAATRINVRLGRPLIQVISPQNESNHPLQDGAHQNGAGQGTAAAIFTFAEAIERASCQAGTCCPRDRFIVDEPAVHRLLAASLIAAEATRDAQIADGVDAALVPEVAISLYLDVEQRDPFQEDDAGEKPPIVTPVPIFLEALKTALGAAAWADRVIYVDTYPGSWTTPWYSNEDGAIHVEPASRRVLRADPVIAADRALERAMEATDAFAAVFGHRPATILGEVGWATFDGDEDAQRRFVARLFEAASARAATDNAFKGFLFFKDSDRAIFAYPAWTASMALGDTPIPCDSSPFGPWLCSVDVLSAMEGQWGLFRKTAAGMIAKPAWDAFVQGLGDATPPASARNGR